MHSTERGLPIFIRLSAYVILILNFAFIVVAVYMADSLQEWLGRVYVHYDRLPEGFSRFVYGHYLHLWLSYLVFAVVVYAIGFRFYSRSNLSVEKRLFFLQLVFFAGSLAMVIFFVVMFLGLFYPLIS